MNLKKGIAGSFVILTLSVLLVSCGFKLRDESYRFPDSWKLIEVESQGSVSINGALSSSLKKKLRDTYKVDVWENRKHGLLNSRSIPKIVLFTENFRNPVSALDTLGRAQEYLLEYSVKFQFIDGSGKSLAPAHRIYIRSEQSYSSSSILAKERENEYLRKSLQRRAATQIIEQLLAKLRMSADKK